MIHCNLSNNVELDNNNDNKNTSIAKWTWVKRTFIIFGVRLDARSSRFETQAIATMEFAKLGN